jgi:hypothetical protein
VMDLAEPVRVRNQIRAAGLDRGVGERNPDNHLQGRLETETVLDALSLINAIVHTASMQLTFGL